MSDIEGLFAPIPTRVPKLPLPIQTQMLIPIPIPNANAVQIPEVGPDARELVESIKPKSFWPSVNVQFYIVVVILVLGIGYLLWTAATKSKGLEIPPIDESVVQRVKAAAASAVEAPTMADIEALPKLHINSVSQPQSQPQIPPKPLSDHDTLKELGKWLRDGLSLRRVAPDIITNIVTFTVRTILQKAAPSPTQLDVVALAPAPAPAPPPPPPKPVAVGGKIDIRGKPIPIFEAAETESAKPEGKINAELDPRLIAILKSRKSPDVE